MGDTHHGFYLLVPEVCHQSAAVVDEVRRVAEEGVDSDLSGDPDVGEGEPAPRGVPLRDVQQPLGGRGCLEQVAKLKYYRFKYEEGERNRDRTV